MAEKVRQAHLLLKRFLIQVLDVDPEVAEEDACLMEHAVSTHTMERLTDFLRRNGYLKEQNSAPDK